MKPYGRQFDQHMCCGNNKKRARRKAKKIIEVDLVEIYCEKNSKNKGKKL